MSNDAECSRCGLDGGIQCRGRVTRRGRTSRGGLNCSKERVGADDGLSASAVQLSLEQNIGVINDIGLDGATVGSTRGVVLCLNELPRRVHILTANEDTDSTDTVSTQVVGGNVGTRCRRKRDVSIRTDDNDLAIEQVRRFTSRIDEVLGTWPQRKACRRCASPDGGRKERQQ
jgi:hypothetical protein